MTGRLLAALALSTALLNGFAARAADDESLKTQSDAKERNAEKPKDPNAYRILFIGDSITRHGTSKSIVAKLKWDRTAGMAASAEAKDYAHLFGDMVKDALAGKKPVETYFHTSGGGGSAAQRLSTIAEALPVKPHLVVIQLGEHEKKEAGEAPFRESYRKLLSAFDGESPKPLILCAGVWNPNGKGQKSSYSDWPARVETIMKEECEAKGIPFASVEKYALDPACSGAGETPGVQWHPNDQGHKGYADELFKLFQKSAEGRK